MIQKFKTFMTEKRWRILISVFIIWNIFAIGASNSKPRSTHNFYEKITYHYLIWTRLNQHWKLFTPQPYKYAQKYRTEIKFKDGKVEKWWRPYPEKWDFFQRHLAYNFQKYDLASNHLRRKDLTWRDLSLFVKRLFWSDENPPVEIKLIHSRALWPPFDDKPRYLPEHVNELEWIDETVFTYDVEKDKFIEI